MVLFPEGEDDSVTDYRVLNIDASVLAPSTPGTLHTTDGGLYAKIPAPPTTTWISAARACGIAARDKRAAQLARVKSIVE